jgi:hypothetical protein
LAKPQSVSGAIEQAMAFGACLDSTNILVYPRICLLVGGRMSKPMLGVLCGLLFGAIAVATMIPLSFEDKRAAMLGAFINRFAIGVVIGAATLPFPGWLTGLVFGLLLSLPDAIITKAYAPIMALGTIGGLMIGFVVAYWGNS